MKSSRRIAPLTTCVAILLIWSIGVLAPSTAFGQSEKPSSQSPPESLEGLRRAAEQGDADAQVNLGFAYEQGEGVRKDYAEGARWFRKAAENGNVRAQDSLGEIYGRGLGVPQDDVEAARWKRKAAEQGYAYAQATLGWMYDQGRGVPQDYAEAAHWYRKAADQGDADAQYRLGVMYKQGHGVPQDYAETIRWFRRACRPGKCARSVQPRLRVRARRRSAAGLRRGSPLVSQSRRTRRDDRSAQPGHHVQLGAGSATGLRRGYPLVSQGRQPGEAIAQSQLGLMYASGHGVPQDYVQAHMWLNLAASGVGGEDQKKFSDARDELAGKMTTQQIAEAQRLAPEWKPKGDGQR